MLTVHGLLLAAGVERSAGWTPPHTADALFHHQITETLLSRAQWSVASAVGAVARTWPGPLRNAFLINYWVAVKGLRGLEQIRGDVQRFEPANDFEQLARFSLLEDDERAVALLKQLLDEGRLTGRGALDWVLLRQLQERNPVARGLLELRHPLPDFEV